MKTIILLFVLLASATLSNAQVELGIKTGVSSIDLSPGSIILPNSHPTTLSISEANYGFHFGLYSRIGIANLYIEPALLLNSSSVDYNLKQEIFDTGIVNTLRSETYNNLDIPLLLGLKIGPLRIQGGPVAHVFISSASSLISIEDYKQNFSDATFGIQGGAGLDIMRFRLDVNYEANLSKFGNHIQVDGQDYAFDQRPGRLIISLGYKF
mgnify:CR=1 FL=1